MIQRQNITLFTEYSNYEVSRDYANPIAVYLIKGWLYLPNLYLMLH